MMNIPPLKEIPITVDAANYTESVKDILKEIKPEWKLDTLKIKELGQGLANVLLLCSCEGFDDKVTMRMAANNESIENCFNRESEINVMRVLSQKQLAVPVLCKFNNGAALGFANGRTLHREDLENATLRRKIIGMFHEIHNTDLKSILGEVDRPGIMSFLDDPWSTIDKGDYTHVTQMDRYKSTFPSLEELRLQVPKMHAYYNELCEKYPIVYCHSDSHIYNIVWDETRDKVTFIDWEDSNWCPEIIDPSMFFDRDLEENDIFRTSECRRIILKEYLMSHPVHGSNPITDELLNKWHKDSLKMSLINSFIAASFAIASIKASDKGDDFLGIAIMSYKRFISYQEELENFPED